MAFKLLMAAEGHWRKVNAPHLVALVKAGEKFPDGEHEMFQEDFWTGNDGKDDESVESTSLKYTAAAL